MNKNIITEIIYILIAIILGILTIKFIIWLLPVILIGMCSFYIYKKLKRAKNNFTKKENQKKTKDIKIIDMVEDDN